MEIDGGAGKSEGERGALGKEEVDDDSDGVRESDGEIASVSMGLEACVVFRDGDGWKDLGGDWFTSLMVLTACL